MLRIHFLQHWFELSDPAAEEALYDSRAMRQFVGIDLGQEPVPDETTICKFRRLMERHNLGDELLRLVNMYLEENGLKLSCGTIVYASIISAPSSARSKDKARDAEMHQTRKGEQFLLAFDNICNVSILPLRAVTIMGLLGFGLAMALTVLIRKLIGEIGVPGWATMVILVPMFSVLVLVSLGILGEYASRVLREVRGALLYLVREMPDGEASSSAGAPQLTRVSFAARGHDA